MNRKKVEPCWQDAWRQIIATMRRHGTSSEVLASVDDVEWSCKDGKLHLYCPRCLYDWIEVPSAPEKESNLRVIKPVLWPLMQRKGCKELVYHLL